MAFQQKENERNYFNPRFAMEKRGKEIWRRKGLAESSEQGEERYFKHIEAQTFGTKGPHEDQEKIDSIQVHSIGNGWLYRSAIGKMRRLVSAQEMEKVFKEENLEKVQIKPFGGRFLIITFPSEEVRDVVIKEKWLSVWFEEVKPWNGDQAKDERFVWIACFGMPINAWTATTFRAIGSKWGHFIEVDGNTLRENSFEKGRILIATEEFRKI